MKKNLFWILIPIILIPCVYYWYKAYEDQDEKNQQIINDCRNKTFFSEKELAVFTLNSNEIQLLFNKKRLNFSKKNYGKGFILKLDLTLNRNAMDTLFIRDSKKTIKMYDFVVDTIIVNKKRNIQCDLKEVTINGKKQYARNLIILD
jgi:hypothetical protein